MALLEVRNLTVRFGGLTSLAEFDLQVDPGSVVALIGPNGAGKTTAFNVITGVYAPTEGSVRFDGRDIGGQRPHVISQLGIGRTFQNIRLFRGLTAAENVRAALAAARRSGLGDVLRTPGWRRREASLEQEARTILERLGLEHVADAGAGGLPYGDQRLLEIARALATHPRLLLLDEPAAGMNPSEKQALRELVARLRSDFGLAVVLIEHDVRFVMDLCERVSVLDHGEKIAEGAPGRRAPGSARDRGLPGHGRDGVVTAPLLAITGLETGYGAIRALHGVSLEVKEGEIVTLIGSNGAGKSTLLRTVSGLLRPWRGAVLFDGADVTFARPEQIVRLGVCHVPEGRRIFANLTVLENLQMGGYVRRRTDARTLEQVLGLFPRLRERLKQAGGTLSGGEQQMLAIGRALMAEPRLLLLDEPSLGLAPRLVQQIFEIVQTINAQGTTVVLVEQNAHQALRIAARAYVLETGELTLQGSAAELAADPRVRRAYLGEEG